MTILTRRLPGCFVSSVVVLCLTSSAFAQSGSRNSVPSSPAPAAQPIQTPAIGGPTISTPSFGNPSFGGNGIVLQQPIPDQSMPFPQSQSLPNQQFVPPQPGMLQPGMLQPGMPAAPRQPSSVWEMHNPNSTHVVDHSSWDVFLSRYLRRDARGLNRVAYRHVSGPDRQLLMSYLAYMQSVDVRALNRQEQLAYWLNLYNAQTVAIVVCKQPLLSIRQVKSDFFDLVGPFDDKVVTVLGQSLSLSDIENDIVRAVYKDPRIHYALNCASVGCPNLQPTAWRAANLSQRLDAAAYEFVNSGRAFKRTLFGINLSSIYKWYADDFGGNDAAVLQHIRRYANPQNQRILCRYNRVARHFYDWSLNIYGKGSNLYGVLLP